MMRILLPLILIVAAIGLFIGFTNPTYANIKQLTVQSDQYNTALAQSTQVRQVRDQLLSRRNTFSTDQIRKLERLLPDNVDNIRLIIDINDIAARYHLQVTNVGLNAGQGGPQGSVGGGASALGSVELSFTVSASYDQFLSFLNDLEGSLRLVDVEDIKFTASAGNQTGTNDYTVRIKTYWLR